MPSQQELSIETFAQSMIPIRDNILSKFLEHESSGNFVKTPWQHHSGGSGEISLLRGAVFEKAAVNFSYVWGPKYPLSDTNSSFKACGISLITHMNNPHVPTSHMNIRMIQLEDRYWIGGGFDLTPMGFTYEDDIHHLHTVAQASLDPFGKELYPQFSANAKEYFYIPHRGRERGIGGIFYDYFSLGSIEKDLVFSEAIVNGFLDAYLPIVAKRTETHYTEKEKSIQLHARGAYVEFNLLYDRGTRFGFLSGGNPDAILCSMPPVVCW